MDAESPCAKFTLSVKRASCVSETFDLFSISTSCVNSSVGFNSI